MRDCPRQLMLFTEASPCQPKLACVHASVAGLKQGEGDERYLWPEFARLVRELKPSWFVGENVPGILSISADRVCSDLEREGYSVGIWDYEAASVLSACYATGAKHRRERVFFVAHAGCTLRQGISETGDIRETDGARNAFAVERPSSALAPDSDSERCEEQRQSIRGETAYTSPEQCSRRKPEPRMGYVVDGISANWTEVD